MNRGSVWWVVARILVAVGSVLFAPNLESFAGQAPATPKTIIRVAFTMPAGLDTDKMAHKFGELLKERTGGEIGVQTFPGGQLGGEVDALEQLTMGALEMTIVGEIAAIRTSPDLAGPMRVPYVFKDPTHLFKFLASPTGEEIKKRILAKTKIRTLAHAMRGERHLTTRDRPVHSVEDIKGMKLRVTEMPVIVQSWKGLGAIPIAIPWPETFTALQQGLVEAQENPLEIIYGHGLYDIQKYLILTGHVTTAYWLHMSDLFYQKLNPAHKKVVEEAASEAALYGDDLNRKSTRELLEKVREKRMTIIAPPRLDLGSFRKSMRDSVIPELKKSWAAGLYETIAGLE